jgi:sugar phosphate isomerase/epimerase
VSTRRTFLRNSAAVFSALTVPRPTAWAQPEIPFGVQLYTVRNQAEHNLPLVLKQIREIGYVEVETYGGLYSRSARDLRRIAAEADLRIPSAHFSYEGFDQSFNYAEELGVRWMICPMLPPSLWTSLDGFRTAAKRLNEWGRRTNLMGMGFAFHNHNYEFRKFGDKTGYDVIIEETDPRLVFFEVDCYWIVQAGLDPVETLQHLGKRVRMIHMKDRRSGFPFSTRLDSAASHFTELGHGSTNWKAVLAEAVRLQIDHAFVEQDQTTGNPIDSLRASFEYLRTVL